MASKIEKFEFKPGRILARKYEVISQLGAGWEGEVYLLREIETNIERAGKFFFPHRNQKNRASRFYALKLHKLRHCPILIQYVTQEHIRFEGHDILFLVSEYVEGRLLSEVLKSRRGKHLTPYEGLHLLHALAKGIEQIHLRNEYHGDLHTDNVIVVRFGLEFHLKLLDVFHWKAPRPENIQSDVLNLIRIFYESLGGKKTYAQMPPVVKEIVCGLKNTLILKKFKTAGHLRRYLESLSWE